MTVQLYDSKAQTLRDFVPLDPSNVTVYVCGPTVQSGPHIGHLRGALSFDILRRWLAHRYGRVTFVRNVTDIDDKVLANASEHEEWWAVAYRVELEFTEAYRTIGILPPTYEPRATASIPQMQELIASLIERGHAYVADDDSGDVYFDVRTWPSYGELTRQRLDDMSESPDAATRGKRDPRDFALWKGTKPAEPESASWAAPGGAGRPGWHIECSAMSRRYLGPAFDIHGGGLDLRFPHHENELAQSSALGDDFAHYWVHNGIVMVEGQKMSKSLGNSIYASEFLALAAPVVVRYYLASAHYRSTIDYHPGALDEAAAALDRIGGFLERSARALESAQVAGPGDGRVPDAFSAAMNDDLGVPEALGVLHETVRAGNSALDAGDLSEVAVLRERVRAMVSVLGVDPTSPEWTHHGVHAADAALGALVERLLADRAAARAAKDWAASDRIRDELAEAGITIDDTPAGSRWSLA